jgi:hypothetical protein
MIERLGLNDTVEGYQRQLLSLESNDGKDPEIDGDPERIPTWYSEHQMQYAAKVAQLTELRRPYHERLEAASKQLLERLIEIRHDYDIACSQLHAKHAPRYVHINIHSERFVMSEERTKLIRNEEDIDLYALQAATHVQYSEARRIYLILVIEISRSMQDIEGYIPPVMPKEAFDAQNI